MFDDAGELSAVLSANELMLSRRTSAERGRGWFAYPSRLDVYAGGNDAITGVADNDILIGKVGTDRIDGGAGNDIVFASKDTAAVVVGGLGRDFIYNTSKGGEVWGDYITGVDPDGNLAADTSENADLFWWAPYVTIKDAQIHDRIVFQGQALTGGSRRRAAACNDNNAWHGAAFRLVTGRWAA